MKKKLILGLLALVVAMQFIRPGKNKGTVEGPEDISHVVTVSPSVKTILAVACNDCHSNHTNYPWYSEIMPFGWWLNHHVEEGKEHLNFSEFATYEKERQDHKLEEMEEEVKEHEMPLESYTWLHKEAKLTEEQTKALVEWVNQARLELKSKN